MNSSVAWRILSGVAWIPPQKSPQTVSLKFTVIGFLCLPVFVWLIGNHELKIKTWCSKQKIEMWKLASEFQFPFSVSNFYFRFFFWIENWNLIFYFRFPLSWKLKIENQSYIFVSPIHRKTVGTWVHAFYTCT